MDLAGAHASFVWDAPGSLRSAISEAFDRAARWRSERSAGVARFPRLPIMAECASSTLPASGFISDEGGRAASAPSAAKRTAARAARRQLMASIGQPGASLTLDQIDAYEDVDWIAIVHADGNGFGQRLLAFGAGLSNLEYATVLSQFSRDVDAAVRRALMDAAQLLPASIEIRRRTTVRLVPPLIPIVAGGDDLTVLCAGAHGRQFTTAFLRSFGEHSATPSVQQVLGHGGGGTACAGIAYTKPHFPFSSGYRLAEELIAAAKSELKAMAPEDPSAIPAAFDFHVRFDSVDAPLSATRRSLRLRPNGANGSAPNGDGDRLWGGPYLLAEGEPPWERCWPAEHIDEAREALVASADTDDTKAPDPIPFSQIQALRTSLRSGRTAADHHFAAVRDRHPALGDVWGGSLFGERSGTTLLDVISLASVEHWHAQPVVADAPIGASA